MIPQTEFEFALPVGYVDEFGNVHRKGKMRLATALDEVAPMGDPRVRSNQAYLAIVLLSRVITKLGALPVVNTKIIENLYVADLTYLQALYRQVNETGKSVIQVTSPDGKTSFEIDLADLGGG